MKIGVFTTDFDGLTIILEEELVNVAKDAYIGGTITGYSNIPSYTVILNKIKNTSKDFGIIKDCVDFKFKQSIEKELEVINKINK